MAILNGRPTVGETESLWHVLHVKPRCEKKMADYCSAHTLTCELPLREETKVYQRRRVTVHKPVFPGYVFVRFGDAERVSVLKSNLVVRDLPVIDQAQFVRQLDQIRMALAVDPTLDACGAFTEGRRVRITGGPFMGLEGVVQTLRARTRVVLNVEMIGQALAVEVGVEMLEPAD